ncbi:P-loop containing nucleoside triphosphate hydrolase protein [Rhexocercosporidium sp. MPI-PUGE-AT-0058]|nr:P-loop containing nucleoside triphosphate hydrolase protein [Rhexocercosporidium sp. MPI-PUGE-AT-0058]
MDQWVCNCCASRIGGSPIPFFYCEECDFALCRECYTPKTQCPDEHPLVKTVKNDQSGELIYGLDSLDISSRNANLKPPNPYSSKPGNSKPPPSSSNPFLPNSDQDGKRIDPSSLGEGEKQLRESLASAIVKESPDVKWEDVAGLEAAKEELQEAVILPVKFPQMFSGKRKLRRGILLYGPPGTGKSYLAKAVATEAESMLFSISSSDVMSKWMGESEKLVKTLFQMARENTPSVIFIDELDALCGSRDAPGHNPHMSGLKTEFMVQIDGVGHDNEGVLLLAATNLPWSLDPAIRRRFQRKVYIPLPDQEAREQMFKIHVGESMADLTEEDYKKFAERTKGLSGSDISIAVQDALNQPVKKVSSSKHWRKVTHEGAEKLTPCKATDDGAMPMSWRTVPASQLLEPDVEVEDFFTVLDKVKPTVSEEEIKKCSDWTELFGTEGA